MDCCADIKSSHSSIANPQHDAFARSGDAGPNPRGVGLGLLGTIGGVGGLGFHVPRLLRRGWHPRRAPRPTAPSAPAPVARVSTMVMMVVKETKRPGLWGRPNCKGILLGVARRGARRRPPLSAEYDYGPTNPDYGPTNPGYCDLEN